MRRILVVVGFVFIALGLALYFSLTRTEVARTLSQGQPVHLLWLLSLSSNGTLDWVLTISLFPGGRVAFVLIPGDLVVPVRGQWTTLSAIYASEGEEGVNHHVTNLLEFRFLLSVVVGPPYFQRVVEAAGGVVVCPEERLIYQDLRSGVVLDFPAGEQLLSGSRAREFLMYAAHYASDPRFSLALDFFANLIVRLWSRKGEALPALCMDQGWEAREFWGRALEAPEDAVVLELLPLAVEDSHLMPDLLKVRKLRDKLVLGRAPLTRDEVRIMVLNGTRERFLATRTASWLSARGFKVVGVGNADRYDYTKAFLVVGPGAEEKATLLQEVLPKDTVVTTPQAFSMEKLGGWPTGADLVLVVGAGFDVGS